MKKKSETATPKKPVNTKGNATGTGAQGSKAQPKASDTAPKWPGGGKKGEDE